MGIRFSIFSEGFDPKKIEIETWVEFRLLIGFETETSWFRPCEPDFN